MRVCVCVCVCVCVYVCACRVCMCVCAVCAHLILVNVEYRICQHVQLCDVVSAPSMSVEYVSI